MRNLLGSKRTNRSSITNNSNQTNTITNQINQLNNAHGLGLGGPLNSTINTNHTI
jgi:hypothetical protein